MAHEQPDRLLISRPSVLTTATVNWHAVFLVAADFLAALGAWLVLRPMPSAFIDASSRQHDIEPGARA